MQKFVYEYATKVYFGEGAAKEHLAAAVSGYGVNVMLAYGGGSVKKNGIYDEVKQILEGAGKKVFDFNGIMPNPTYAKVQEGAELAKKEHIDFILAVGGGSVIDCCKIIAAQARTDKDLWEMEMTDHQFPTDVLPMGAVVTASGTGAEMNGGAVITNEEKVIKAGMAAAAPRFAILDPAYTASVPRMQVISGAFDTLSHAMETYFGKSDQDNVSDNVALAIMKNTVANMKRLLENIDDMQARGNLMWDSAMAENGILKVGFETVSVPRAVATLAIPTIISQVVTMIYNLADTFFVGQIGNPYMVAAVSLVSPWFNLLTALGNLFGLGGGSLISRMQSGCTADFREFPDQLYASGHGNRRTGRSHNPADLLSVGRRQYASCNGIYRKQWQVCRRPGFSSHSQNISCAGGDGCQRRCPDLRRRSLSIPQRSV